MKNSAFDSTLLNSDAAVVYFWSPSCHKCKLLKEGIDSVVRNKGLTLIRIDASTEMDTTLKYGVLGLPTLIFFRNGKEEIRLTSSDVSMAAIEKACSDIRGNDRCPPTS